MPRNRRTPTSNIAEFEALAKLLNISVLLLDCDTNLKFASADAPSLFGSSDADDLKRGWRDCYKRLQLPDLFQLEKNSKPLRYRAELQSSNSTRLLRMEIYPLRHGDCECYVMLVKDRQVLGALEQQLILASQHQVQRYLISTLVHDLNAPINTMRITLELMERMPFTTAFGVSSDFVTKWERYKGILREELGRLRTQVADIPNLFGPEKYATSIVFDVRDVIKEVAKFLKHETTSKQIRMELLLPADPIIVHGSPFDLKLALLNLAVSLVEASRQGEHLRIHAFSSQMFAEVIFHAEAAQIQAREDYQNLTCVPTGSGAGIYVARMLVEAYGGEVQVTAPTEAQSATIRLLLPLHVPPRESTG